MGATCSPAAKRANLRSTCKGRVCVAAGVCCRFLADGYLLFCFALSNDCPCNMLAYVHICRDMRAHTLALPARIHAVHRSSIHADVHLKLQLLLLPVSHYVQHDTIACVQHYPLARRSDARMSQTSDRQLAKFGQDACSLHRFVGGLCVSHVLLQCSGLSPQGIALDAVVCSFAATGDTCRLRRRAKMPRRTKQRRRRKTMGELKR